MCGVAWCGVVWCGVVWCGVCVCVCVCVCREEMGSWMHAPSRTLEFTRECAAEVFGRQTAREPHGGSNETFRHYT